MAKGDIYKNKIFKYNDEYTGKQVFRLTSPEYLSHHPYFYNKMFTNDSKNLIYASNMDGNRNYYKLNINTGESLQLTEGENVKDYCANLSHDDLYLFITRKETLIRLNLDSLDEEIIYENDSDVIGTGIGYSSDSRYVIKTQMKKSDYVPPKVGHTNLQEQWEKKPECRIVMIDVENKKSKVIYEEKTWLGHPQIRPGDNSTIMFCHEGLWEKVDARIWLINADGTNLRCAKPRVGEEKIGHEFWLHDGSRIAYLFCSNDSITGSYFTDNDLITFLDPDTLKEEIISKCPAFCHFITSPDNKMIVGDSRSKEAAFVYIIDVESKELKKLCFHGTSWKHTYGSSQDAHVHPAFSPDQTMVVFTSDKDGLPCVYLSKL